MRSSQQPMRCGAAATSPTNRLTSGAKGYGVMELSGNVAELVIALRSVNSFPATFAKSVSHRQLNGYFFAARSGFHGGRGGY